MAARRAKVACAACPPANEDSALRGLRLCRCPGIKHQIKPTAGGYAGCPGGWFLPPVLPILVNRPVSASLPTGWSGHQRSNPLLPICYTAGHYV